MWVHPLFSPLKCCSSTRKLAQENIDNPNREPNIHRSNIQPGLLRWSFKMSGKEIWNTCLLDFELVKSGVSHLHHLKPSISIESKTCESNWNANKNTWLELKWDMSAYQWERVLKSEIGCESVGHENRMKMGHRLLPLWNSRWDANNHEIPTKTIPQLFTENSHGLVDI